ncbi:hypothetical protein Syun_027449 [Stephania yunnanensis]|uniref:Uncharacterized protein n=1 Tax=Stephania yunnanensis TaxID=152371 RepID=A0AAP0EL34_9MAGN
MKIEEENKAQFGNHLSQTLGEYECRFISNLSLSYTTFDSRVDKLESRMLEHGAELRKEILQAIKASNDKGWRIFNRVMNAKNARITKDDNIIILTTIRATINHLRSTATPATTTATSTTTAPSDLLLYSHISPIGSACHRHPDLLHRYMNRTPTLSAPPTYPSPNPPPPRRHPLLARRRASLLPPSPLSSDPMTSRPSLPPITTQPRPLLIPPKPTGLWLLQSNQLQHPSTSKGKGEEVLGDYL